MLCLILSAVLTIIFTVLVIKLDDDELVWTLSVIAGIFSAGWFIAMVVMSIIASIPWCNEQEKIKYDEKRKAILYCIETNPDSVKALASDIADYNATVLRGKRLNDGIWTNLETYNFWDELKLIVLGGDA